MVLFIDDKPLDLGNGTTIQVQRQSPIFGDGSAISIPISIPLTGSNSLTLNFPGRLDTATDMHGTRDGVLDLPGKRRNVKVNITEAGGDDSAALTLGWCNSAAYVELMDRKLPELTCLPCFSFKSWSSFAQTMVYCYENSSLLDDGYYSIFPVCVSVDEINGENDTKVKVYEVLNLPYAIGRRADYTRKAIIDGSPANVTVPAGYGVTPMVRVWFAIEKVFEEAGLKVLNNPFFDNENLRRLTILSNVADACVKSHTFNLADVLPDISVGDFLKSLWCRFGLVWDVDFDNASVNLKLLRDILAEPSAINLTRYHVAPGHISYLEPQYVKMTAQTVSDDAKPATDTWNEFITGRSLSAPTLVDNEAIPSRSNFTFNFKNWRWRIYNLERRTLVADSSSNFNYDPAPAGFAAFDLNGTDSVVDFEKVSMSWKDAANNTYMTFDGYMPMLLSGAKHLYTELNGSNDKKEEPARAPLVFLYADYPAATKGQKLTADSSVLGSPDFPALVCDFKGGLFDCFWRKFDEVLRFGNRRMEVRCRMPLYVLESLDLLRPVTFDNIKCLIESIDYSIPGSDLVEATITFRTIDTQGHYDIDALHALPALDDAPRNLRWDYLSDNAETIARDMSIWVNAINQLSQLLGKPASWVKSHVTSKSYSIRYPGLTWQTDPRNNVGTFPGDKTTREYNMIVHFEIEIESEEGGGYYEIDVDTACQVKLYCVFARVPEPQETPGHDDQTNYEPVEPDVPGDYYPDPDDRPEPWEDNYDDYWDDRD